MAITIKDVALLAGVSYQTVSRVINNSKNISPETYKNVTDAIKKLNYYPNSMARNLNKEIVNAIGLTIPMSAHEITLNTFFSAIIGEVSGICSQKGIRLNVFSFDEHNEDADMIIRLYKEKIIGGVLLTCPGLDIHCIMSLLYNKIPFVIIGRPNLDFGVSYVDIDNEDIAYKATHELLERGHKRIALINGPDYMTYSVDLLSGYKRALSEYNIDLKQAYVLNTNLVFSDSKPSDYEFITQNDISAIICANDNLALGIVGFLKAKNLSIPDDVSLMTLNYNSWFSLLTPSLAGVDMRSSQLAIEATNMLLALMFDKSIEPRKVLLKSEMIKGDSIGIAKI